MDLDSGCAGASPGKDMKQLLHSCRFALTLIKVVCFGLFQGVLGGLCSGKSALVHRHLTGSYVALENAEGRLSISCSSASSLFVFL